MGPANQRVGLSTGVEIVHDPPFTSAHSRLPPTTTTAPHHAHVMTVRLRKQFQVTLPSCNLFFCLSLAAGGLLVVRGNGRPTGICLLGDIGRLLRYRAIRSTQGHSHCTLSITFAHINFIIGVGTRSSPASASNDKFSESAPHRLGRRLKHYRAR